jgi:WhiB family redox-sensing transcriptional regulator
MTSWRDAAACRGEDVDLFFPIGYSEAFAVEIGNAKQICNSCPVREHCLAEALNVGDKHGIFGGMTPDERAKQRRRNRRTAPRRQQDVKECARCHFTLPVGKFYQRPEREGGRDAYCRPCCAERARERRAAKEAVAS